MARGRLKIRVHRFATKRSEAARSGSVQRLPRSYFAALPVLLLFIATAPANAQYGLKSYNSRYYEILTDLDASGVREARLRMTLMFEEYAKRTRGFAGQGVRDRLPFLLFSRLEDYIAAGGPPGTAGVFDGRRLMAVADPRFGDRVWNTVQHEGFHQFLVGAVGGDIPIWANEGLAEYFGEGLFTGDEFIVGVISPERLRRLKERFSAGQFRPLRDMMLLQHESWNAEGSIVNYDQAWSMVHFLAHAENGKYREHFDGFLRSISQGEKWEPAWLRHFGRGVREFEQRGRAYWEGLAEDPTSDLYDRAAFSTLTGFFARAASQRQYFDTIEDFFDAARDGKLKSHKEDWLPPRLLAAALDRAPRMGEWSFLKGSGGRRLVVISPAGNHMTGSFQLSGSRVKAIQVKTDTVKSR